MPKLSVGTAFESGFALFARRPLSASAWGLVFLLLAYGPNALILTWVLPDFAVFAERHGGAAEAGAAFEALPASVLKLQLVNLLQILGMIAAHGIVAAAVFRTMLRPQDSGGFALRLGKAEGFQALVYLVQMIMAGLWTLVVVLAATALGAAIWFAAAAAPAGATLALRIVCVTVLSFTALGLIAWPLLRLSLAGPMTFAEGGFRLFESWALTKGQSWRLFGLAFLIWLVTLGLTLFVYVALIVVLVAFGVGAAALAPQDALARFEALSDSVKLAWALGVGGLFLALGSLISGFFLSVWLAPWASAYKQLAASASGAHATEN